LETKNLHEIHFTNYTISYDFGKGVSVTDDKNMIALFWKRDENALREFEKSYKRLCLDIARFVTGDDGDAEECYNDTCLRLWNTIPPETPRSMKAYAARIVRNLALNRLEKSHAAKRSALLTELDEVAIADIPDPGEGELSGIIDSFLETQPPLSVKLFVKRYYYSEAVSKIAAELSISENKASKLLAKIRTSLRTYLTERGVSL